VSPLTENESDGSALPTAQHHEAVRQPSHERGVLEVVMTVVGVVVNWLGTPSFKGMVAGVMCTSPSSRMGRKDKMCISPSSGMGWKGMMCASPLFGTGLKGKHF